MLGETTEHWLEFSNWGFEDVWRVTAGGLAPQTFYCFSIIYTDFAFHTDRIFCIYFRHELPRKEIFSQRNCIWHALQTAIHKTSVSQILQPSQSLPRIWTETHINWRFGVDFISELADSNMIPHIFVFALLRTVVCFSTLAFKFNWLDILTILTFGSFPWRILQIFPFFLVCEDPSIVVIPHLNYDNVVVSNTEISYGLLSRELFCLIRIWAYL